MEIFEVTESNAKLDKKELSTYIDNTKFSNEIKEAIKGILGVVLPSGNNDITLDFVDLQTIMSHKGMALMGVGECEGKNSANEAIKQSIEYALQDDILLNEVRGILIHFHIHPDFPIMEIAEAMEIIHDGVHDDADIIWGTTTNETVNIEYIKATMLLTGFEKNTVANNADYQG